MIQFDFTDRLNEFINSQGYDIKSRIGLAQRDGSISVLMLPGGQEEVYMDGSKDKIHTVQILSKLPECDHQNSLILLNDLSNRLSDLETLPSSNGSYELNDITIVALPSFVAEDDKGNVLYTFSFNASLFIKKGVI